MKQTLRQAFWACEYHADYVKRYGNAYDAAFHAWLHGNFSRWLHDEYPPLQACPPTLSERDCIDLIDQYRENWEFQQVAAAEQRQLAVRILAEGERHEAWLLPVVEGLLTPAYWARVWLQPAPAPVARPRGALRLVVDNTVGAPA